MKQFHKLLHYKKFIRQLGRNKIDKYKIACNYNAVVELTKIALNYNEICSETSTGSSRRMGKNKIKRCLSETSVSECSSSEGSEISTSESTDTNISEGSGKIQLKKKPIEEKLTLFTSCLPLSKSDRILTILRYMIDNKDISWTVDGNLKYKGKVIQPSSIVKLLCHTIWKDIKIKPKGINFFYKTLSSLNIPKILYLMN